MGIAITFRHLNSSDAIKEYVHEKLERVQKYLRQPLDAHVTLSAERHQHVAEISMNSSGRQYQARHDSDDMYKSIDFMIDKVEHQIAKHHDTQARNKKGAEGVRALATDGVAVPGDSGTPGE
jgi:putative sigma-54 modulation protein